MNVDLSTPETASSATGKTDAKGSGFDVEAGYAYKLKSGFTLSPQLQYARVDVDLDDFASSNRAYALTRVGGKASLLRAGITASRNFETENGSVTPLVALSFVNSGGQSHLLSNGVDFANDTKGAGYKAELGINAAYKAWDIGVRTGIGDTSKSTPSLSTNLVLRYLW
jgi:outer membrane autotransporter protein